jgi:hypothetical protein
MPGFLFSSRKAGQQIRLLGSARSVNFFTYNHFSTFSIPILIFPAWRASFGDCEKFEEAQGQLI